MTGGRADSGGMSVPEVDYAATSARLAWSAVPPEVVAAVGAALGSPVASASAPVGSGFGGHFAGRVCLVDGRTVFVKVAPPTLTFVTGSLRQEARVLSWLPADVPHAHLLAHVSVGGWEALALDTVVGRMPGFPWTPRDLDATYDACSAIAATPVPSSVGLESRHQSPSAAESETLEALRHGSFAPPAGLGPLLTAHGPEIFELADRWAGITGDVLLHQDLRPDNLLIDGSGRAVVLDWNWVSLGPAWVDFVGVLPMAHRQSVDVTPWLRRDLFAGATADDVDAFLASLSVYFLSQERLPPMEGCLPAVRDHQLLYAHDFLGLLADRRRWRRLLPPARSARPPSPAEA